MKANHELKLLTEKQMAEALGVSTRTARRLRDQRILPYYKLTKGIVRYDLQQCARALDQYRIKSNAEAKEEASDN